ncbi:MAG: hypothetical protein J7604_25115 [Sporocytophaga sp.]|uniref:hypothetical protein n=1 Tax=Sporocytophaga sp. TaxID=2231183 RepID=UPI001B0E1C82|nr:hypothetical protein [Sporocytophaga sp.]MBO9703513.1 hypothetical protein [Sporocytophaga sp.]
MKKWRIAICMLFSFSAAFGQQSIKDSIFLNVKKEAQNLFIEKVCNDFLVRAEDLVRKDSLCLPQYKSERPTQTYRLWMEATYSIYDYDYCPMCCVILCSNCFDDYMIWAIEQKFGKGFLEEQKKISDSLDRIGMGFKDPAYPMSEDSLRKIIHLKARKKEKPLDAYSEKIVCFEIDEHGHVADIHVFEGPFIFKSLAETDELKVLLKKLFKDDQKWTPAMFLGKPINGQYIISVSL